MWQPQKQALLLRLQDAEPGCITCGKALTPAPVDCEDPVPVANTSVWSPRVGAGAACEESDWGVPRDAGEGDVSRSGVLVDDSRAWLSWLCAAKRGRSAHVDAEAAMRVAGGTAANDLTRQDLGPTGAEDELREAG